MASPVPSPSPELNNEPMDADATASMSNLLSFPSNESPSSANLNDATTPGPSIRSGSTSKQLLNDRLFIGNLHPAVDEYTLLQVFTKYGKVTKLDFLFHKAGALKGKPRGYAFLEYGTSAEAQKAQASAHDKLLHGRKLVVTHAHQAPSDADGLGRQRKTMMETGRPTTLSMLKSGANAKHKEGTSNKIAMMEAKLRELESSRPVDEAGTSTLPVSRLPTHPSLPNKPPPTVPGAQMPHAPVSRPHSAGLSLPQSRPSSAARPSSVALRQSSSGSGEPPSKKPKLLPAPASSLADGTKRKTGGKGFLGVKIVKKRDSPSPSTPFPNSSNDNAATDQLQIPHAELDSAVDMDSNS